MHPLRLVLGLLAAALLLAACGEEAPPPAAGTGETGGSPPMASKGMLVDHLRSTLAAIEAEDWEAAAAHFHLGPRAPKPAEYPEAFRGMVTKREIGAAGIDILAAKGTFGPLAEVFPERGASWAERAGVALASCYALAYDGAEVAAFFDGASYRLIRLDDVGKLE